MRLLSPLLLVMTLSSAGSSEDEFGTPVRTGMLSPKDHGLAIGIEDYAFIPGVPYAKRDAQAFYDLLAYSRGVPLDQLRLLNHQVSREKIIDAVTRMGEEAGPGSTVWIYYAGHGAGSPEHGGRILLGADTQQDPTSFESRAVEVEELKRLAGANGARVMLITDTCFTGSGRGGEELITGKRFLVPTYAMSSGPMSQEWVAASPGQMSGPLHDKQHGAFTYFTIAALRGSADGELSGVRDGEVTVQEMQAYVTRMLRTSQVYEQTPQLLGSGDWVMISGVAEGLVAEPAPAQAAVAVAKPTPALVAPTAKEGPSGLSVGLTLGTPTGGRIGYEFGHDKQLTAIGVRAGIDFGFPLISPYTAYATVPAGLYADIRLSERWDFEVMAGAGGGLALQYDPPTGFQLQLGAIIALEVISGYPSIGPDVAVEWMW